MCTASYVVAVAECAIVVQGNSSDNNKILQDSTNKGCSLIAEVSNDYDN